ncbi:MAG: hypothetical protein P4M04_00405 [Acidobacteriota bacterium]|nr:hypothetical protein [Acidobacteriota bacterium]
MRKASIVLVVVLFAVVCLGQQAGPTTVTVSGCVVNMNGSFKLLTPGQTCVLNGHHSALFSYNGKLVEVTGTVDTPSKSPGIPVVLHVTHLKKLADFCQ